MSRKASTFKKTDLTRALKSAKDAGLDIAGYEFDPSTGRIHISVGKQNELSERGGAAPGENPWDTI